ncbi:MAG TPA: hypothetical protein PLC98_18575 [Anaerolineales bacterium]|nr:hypothetical protein [Anaerolineales bacterium]
MMLLPVMLRGLPAPAWVRGLQVALRRLLGRRSGAGPLGRPERRVL